MMNYTNEVKQVMLVFFRWLWKVRSWL